MRNTIVTLALVLGAVPASALAQNVSNGQLRAEVVGLRTNQGNVRCMLYNSSQATSFARDLSAAQQTTVAPIANGRAECLFTGLSPGTYAVAAYHDQNDNGMLDRRGHGRGGPLEGVAASNNAKGHMGPPHFGHAQFVFNGGDQTVQMQMRY